MHVSMMRVFFVTNEPTDKAILGVGYTYDVCMHDIGVHDACMYVPCMHDGCIHVCMMRVWLRHKCMIHVCMMQERVMLVRMFA